MNKGSSIFIGHEETSNAAALIIAEGTAEKPVIFRPASGAETPGSWGHIFISRTASPQSTFRYCQFLFF